MHLSPLSESQISQVAILHNNLLCEIQKATNDPYFQFDELTTDKPIQFFEESITNNNAQTFVAIENEIIIGFISGEIIDNLLPMSKVINVGYISGAYIVPEYRNKGIMKELEAEIISWFKLREIEYVELHVIANNATAKTCWNSLGYKTFREQRRKKI